MKNPNWLAALALVVSCSATAVAQTAGFDSFVSRISKTYKVDVAIAPELIPRIDSILATGTAITSIQDMLNFLVSKDNISYQLIDGNKLMLRAEPVDASAGNTILLQGNIRSKEDNTPLSFAAIHVLKTTHGCLSDEQGHFELAIPDSAAMVQIDYLGYAPVTLPASSLLGHGKTIHLTLKEMPLEEVTIVIPYKEVMQDMENQSFSLNGYEIISETDLMKGNADRMINALTSYTPFSSDEGIRLRSAAAENSLILMDELPVYDPYHFYNIFSPFNSYYFSSVSVYKNNIPVQYGGRIDGLVSLVSKNQKSSSRLVFDTDLLLTSFGAKVVLPGEFVLEAGGRISHTDILNEALKDSAVTNFSVPGKYLSDNEWTTVQQPRTDFYDINAGLTKNFKTGSVYASFFKSRDELENTTYSDLQTTGFNQQIISFQQTYAETDTWKNVGLAAGSDFNVSDRTTMKWDIYHARFDRQMSYTNNNTQDRDNHPPMHNSNDGYQNNKVNSTGFKGTLLHQTRHSDAITGGVDLAFHHTYLEAKEDHSPYLEQTQHETEVSLFGEYQTRITDHLHVFAGGRLTHLQSTGKFYLLPEVRTNYFFNTHTFLKAAYSRNLQALHEVTVENRYGRELKTWVLSNPSVGLPALRSDKYMIGAGYNTMHFSFDLEVFYKKMNGLTRVGTLMPDPDHQHGPDPGTDDFYQLFSGDGWAGGVDFTFIGKWNKLEGVLYYSISKLAERYDRLFNGHYFSPQEDRRHQLKLSGKYNFGRFDFGALMTYKSKAPYISFARLDGRGGGLSMVDQQNVVRYLPAFFSLDLSLDYSFPLFKQQAQVGVSLINATNHSNIDELQHIGKVSRDNGEGGLYLTQQTELLGRTANAHFRIMF